MRNKSIENDNVNFLISIFTYFMRNKSTKNDNLTFHNKRFQINVPNFFSCNSKLYQLHSRNECIY